MPNDGEIWQATRRFAAEVARRQGERYAGAVVFGSRARNQAGPDSDVDVAVILKGPSGDFLRTKLTLADLAYDVLLDTGVYIQPLPVWEEEWLMPERHRNPRLVEIIHREGIPV